MSGLFAGTPLERPVTCVVCEKPLEDCGCPRGTDGSVVRPVDQSPVVRREKRKKGKVVTAVFGLDPVAVDLKALVKALRSACGAGGTVTEGGFEIQGEHVDRVFEELKQRGFKVRRG